MTMTLALLSYPAALSALAPNAVHAGDTTGVLSAYVAPFVLVFVRVLLLPDADRR